MRRRRGQRGQEETADMGRPMAVLPGRKKEMGRERKGEDPAGKTGRRKNVPVHLRLKT